jgi:cyanophycinase
VSRQPGALALVGSGEFLPVMKDVDRLLLEGRPPVVAVLSTAAAPEGPGTVRRWHDLARRHYDSLGVTTVTVPVTNRESADDPANRALLEGAGLIYLSGGNPSFLTNTLRGTAVWQAITEAWCAGASVAGCSAGAMAMGAVTFSARGLDGTIDGLGLVSHVAVLPHFDRLVSWQPQIFDEALDRVPPGVEVIGVDEDTALLWQPDSGWSVHGLGRVWAADALRERRPLVPGGSVALAHPLPPDGTVAG